MNPVPKDRVFSCPHRRGDIPVPQKNARLPKTPPENQKAPLERRHPRRQIPNPAELELSAPRHPQQPEHQTGGRTFQSANPIKKNQTFKENPENRNVHPWERRRPRRHITHPEINLQKRANLFLRNSLPSLTGRSAPINSNVPPAFHESAGQGHGFMISTIYPDFHPLSRFHSPSHPGCRDNFNIRPVGY